MRKEKFLENLLVLSVSLLLLLGLVLCSDLMFEDHPLYYGKWMHFDYLNVTENFPKFDLIAPYCWRLLAPFLVHILPFSTHIGFLILSYSSIIISSLLIYHILFILFNDKRYAWLGVLTFFSLVFVVRINVIEFIAVDPLAFLFILLSIYVLLKRKLILFVIFTALGILTKETILIVIPLYFTINYINNTDYENLKLLLMTILLALPSLMMYMLLRILIVPEGSYDFVDLLVNTTKYRIETFLGKYSTLNKNLFVNQSFLINSLINIYRITFGAIGPMLIYIIVKYKKNKELFFRFSPIIIVSFLQIFVAGDNERLVAAGFPAYIILYVNSIKSFIEEDGIPFWITLLYSIIIYLVQLFMIKDHYWQTYYSVVLQLIIGILSLIIFYIFSAKLYKKQIKKIL